MRWRVDMEEIAAWSSQVRRALRSAIEWWLTGLLTPLPSDWQRRLLGRFGRVLLEQRSGEWFAAWATGPSRQISAAAVGLSPDHPFDVARAALGLSSTTRVVLVVGNDIVLHRRLSLPAVGGAVLKNVVRNEIERLTPIAGEDLALQYRVARHDRVQKRVLVDTFVTRASAVETLVAKWVARGWVIGGVTIRRGENVELSLDFSTEKQRSRTWRSAVPLPRWPLAVAVAASIIALYAPGLRYAAQRDAYAAEVSELRTAAVAARDTLARRDASVSRDRFLVQQRASRALALVAFDELTRILPDDTWLHQVHLRGGSIQIQGDSASASVVVQLLEQSPIFADAKFSAPISSSAGDDRERFVIDLRLAPEEAL
jgi:general secretion pathway protein L